MLSQADNDLLCRVGPGTPAGELLRRYWHPIAVASTRISSVHATRALIALPIVLLQIERRGDVSAAAPVTFESIPARATG